MAGPLIEQAPTPLVTGGKPEVFYAGSEACPFCGVQRWGMIVALSQFGTFSHLHLMQSIATNAPAGQDLHVLRIELPQPLHLVYSGRGVEQPRQAVLQPLTHPERALFHEFDPSSQTPFIDVANRFITVDSTVDPQLIAHKSWTQLASALTDTSNVSTQAIAGEAEVFTAELCEATGGNPQSVCSSTVVQQYEAALPNPARAGRVLSGAHRARAARRRRAMPWRARRAGARRPGRSPPRPAARSRSSGRR